MTAVEANFDGLVGLTHSYAGLSYGNIASMSHKGAAANPREAALQGLRKAKALADLGYTQGLLPPQERPDVHALRTLGFSGTDTEVLADAARRAPEILACCSAASSMWTANAATVSPSADSADGKTHFTAANLNQKLHRSIEHETTSRALKAIFASGKHFAHHPALLGSVALGDEGAANHTRFCREYGEAGVQLFVYGRKALDSNANGPKIFPARQTREASEAVARLHQLNFDNTIFAAQEPSTIDAGAFHNDVVSVGNRNVLFFHERAFADSKSLVEELKRKMAKVCETEFVPVEVPDSKVPLKDAIKSYLFNSQLISGPRHMILVAPHECEETPSVKAYLEELTQSGPIREVKFFDLRQSMRNGGGPACLRLRVVLTPDELAHLNKGVLMNDSNFAKLSSWVTRHYRERLSAQDLADPQLLIENRTALDELTQVMNLGSIYAFQREGG